MCNCNSPWVKKARNFISSSHNNQNGKWHTVNFLLNNNVCGIGNRKSIEEILQYLNSRGIVINREKFQQSILGELKREGIVATLIYPGIQGGVFIPCSENEIKEVANQVLSRIDSEVKNLAGIAQYTAFNRLFSLLAYIINWMRQNI